jgi:hypothetical protein
LHTDALAVQISGRTDACVLIYIDIRMAEHPFDENGYRRVAEGFVLQIGDIEAGVKLGNIEFSAVDFCMPARIFVYVDLQIDAFRLDRSIDQGRARS